MEPVYGANMYTEPVYGAIAESQYLELVYVASTCS